MSNLMEESKQFGLVDVPQNYGPVFRVWSSEYNCVTVPTGQYPKEAMWQGNKIVVKFENAPTRVYHDLDSAAYTQMY